MNDIICVWKDETHHQSSLAKEQAMLSTNFAGGIELTDAQLEAVYGARGRDFAPVPPSCLQSILLGIGHCESPG